MSTSPWIFALGFFAQGLFAARMLVQWLLSEKAGKVINPTVFWILSLIASLLFFIYGWLRQDFALMLGQVWPSRPPPSASSLPTGRRCARSCSTTTPFPDGC